MRPGQFDRGELQCTASAPLHGRWRLWRGRFWAAGPAPCSVWLPLQPGRRGAALCLSEQWHKRPSERECVG